MLRLVFTYSAVSVSVVLGAMMTVRLLDDKGSEWAKRVEPEGLEVSVCVGFFFTFYPTLGQN